jgi:amino acid adenylation domain-containing protein/non-ribosomal peptide synthase protein (TIGR01720 family)
MNNPLDPAVLRTLTSRRHLLKELLERKVERSRSFPLSFAQERLWFLDQLEPGSPFYNMPAAVRVTGPLNVAALRASLNEIVSRHEALRTTFATVDGRPVQRISAELSVPLEVVDLSGMPEAEREEAIRSRAVAEAQGPFDLSAGPLLRVCLLRTSVTEHVFLLTMHHIVSDGWSMGVFIRELAALYQAFTADQPSPLEVLPIQYADYAVWQRKWLSGAVLEEQLAYWRNELGDAPAALEIPTDRTRPAVRSFRGADCPLELSAELTEKLRELGRRQSATLFMTLLGAFQALLSRYSGQEQVCVGTPIAGRNRPEIEGLIGFFVNTLVLRADLSDDPSFAQFLGRVRETALRAYAHQDLPFEQLVGHLQPERDLSRTPLFQVMFAFQSNPMQDVEVADLSFSPLAAETGTARFDLTLSLSETAGGLSGSLNYNTDLFEEATVLRMLEHFRNLLQSIAGDPEQRISQLSLLEENERHELLLAWNDTATHYPLDKCLHELFEQQVERTPEAVAVASGDNRLTYRELNARSNQLAHWLRQHETGPDVLVGVCMERSLEMVIALYGILKAGGAYVPLDPEYPHARLASIVEDSRLRIVLTQDHLREVLDTFSGQSLCLDTQWEDELAGQLRSNPENLARPDNLAYVIYTSGSTGGPKGVMIEHAGICNRLWWMQQMYGLTASDQVLQKTPFSFDVSVWEFFWPLLNGAGLVVARPGGHKDSRYLVELIREAAVTTLHFVPSMLQLFVEEEGAKDCRSIRRVICSGEALPHHLQERFFERLPWCELHNLYGPTEASVDVTYWECRRDDPRRIVPIGRPIANMRTYVLDAHLRPVPVGVAGELHLSGVGLARGYLNRTELTEERFLASPFADAPYDRLYKTGDLCRWLADGSLEYLGRLDFQVKIRGNRIELGEIEAVLSEHAALREAVVLAREARTGEKRLVAYVVPHNQVAPSVDELRNHLQSRLPEYMVPSAFVVLESFPLSPNGKVDRKALPEPSSSRPDLEKQYVAPRTPLEQTLADIWRELLGIDSVGIHDNFFDLGGHSLLATQLASRVRHALQAEVPLRELFEHPTVARLAAAIERVVGAGHTTAVPPLKPVERIEELPLSFAQERLWFLDQLEPGSPFYNMPAAVRVSGPLDVEALRASLNEIVSRHEALRTTFATVDGRPVQRISAEFSVPLEVVDLSGMPEAEREEAIRSRAVAAAQGPFDLSTGPLLRFCLLRANATEHVFLLTMHHIVSDGWSMGVFIRELAALYQAFSMDQPSPLGELSIQYADYAVWQREWLSGAVFEEQLAYWRSELGDAPAALDIPTDRPRPAIQSPRGSRYSFELSVELTESLHALSRQQDATLFMTLLGVFQTLLSRYSGQEQVCVGTPIAGRNRSELEALIGFFVNTLVMRGDLSGNPSFEEFLRRVRQTTLDAYAHQDLPFEQLVDHLQPERDLSRTPLFQVMFAFQNVPTQDLEVADLSFSTLEAERGTANFDLTLSMNETEGGLRGSIEYNTDLFDGSTIERMTEHFRQLLKAVVDNPTQRVSELSLLHEQERRRILIDWNATDQSYPREECIHELFAERAAEQPDAIAVVFDDNRLTYRQLDEQSNQLAHHLRSLGVGPDVLVGIYTERSLKMVVGLLGILKAGGAYVPLDPSFPQQRIEWMLEDAQAPVLLVQDSLLERLPEYPGKVVRLDADWEIIARQLGQPLETAVGAEHLAYVIFTSGSTGRPKGVMIPHRALVNFLCSMQREPGLKPSDVLLSVTTFSFDIFGLELCLPLLVGATMVVADDETASDAALLQRELDRCGATVMQATPATWRMLLQANWPGRFGLKMLVGGEALDAQLARELLKRGDTLWNLYGPTETTIWSTACRIPPDFERISIGRPIGNTQIYILDERMEPVPVGVRGDLYIGGDGLARGYLNRPELTDEKFIAAPFDSTVGARLYKTGDQARWLANGEIDFLGRVDHQVKVRGFRIELGEIESVLSQHEAVHQAVVVARPDAMGEQRLVAYVVFVEGQRVAVESLREALGSHLPDYMIPSVFETLDAFPLTPNGKVDRKALPEPSSTRPDLEKQYVAPSTPIEQALVEIWRELLGLDRVGVHDSFFHVGGHSLLAVQLISRVRQAFRVEVPLRDVFEQPTVARLAAAIEQIRNDARADAGPPLLPVERTEGLPLSFAQERLWFLDQLEPGSPFYNMPAAVRVTGALDVEALRASLNEIVSRHEALRTTFATVDGRPVQRIAEQLPVPLEVVDLSEMSEAEREAEIRSRAIAEAQRPFDLSAGPLLRVCLLRASATEHVFLLTIHHVVSDGWSMGVFIRELAALYQAFSAGQPSPLDKLAVQYADYAAWQREWLAGEVLERQLDYWQRELGDAPTVLQLPTDRPRPAVQSPRGSRYPFELSAELTESLHALSRRQDATLFMTLLGAFQTLLSRYSGQEQVCIGTPIAGRNRSELEGLIGFFVNTLVMRGDLSGNPRFEEFLGRVRQTTLDAYAHQDLPFEQLVDHLQPERDLSRTPLFQVMFAFQNVPTQDLEVADLSFSALELERETANFDLTLSIDETKGGLRGSIEYNTDLFDRSTIERMTGQFQRLLESIVADPTQTVGELSLLSEEERQQLLVEWNATQADYPRDVCVHELFEAQALQTPDAVAVVWEDRRLTYGELNSRSNQLAHRLRKLGVGPEVLVGICVDRSLDMVVGILGILKAGGAYVPLDPDYPRERSAFICEDARLRLLLTREHLRERVSDLVEHILYLDAQGEFTVEDAEEGLPPAASPDNLIYVIYTSGTTGQPKGVQVQHGSVANYVLGAARQFEVTGKDRILQFASITFDAAVEEIFVCLTRGAALVLRSDAMLASAASFLDACRDQRITVVDLPTAYWHELTRQITAGSHALPDALRLVIIGGERALPERLTNWQQSVGSRVRLINTYGPTEATVVATTWEASHLSEPQGVVQEVPIGRPVANAQVYVLDRNLQPVPVGVPGELCIGGRGLARGYLNRPELTAERFILNPFDQESGSRLYRTGDLVRWLPDGHLVYVGRLDDQVKIRGFRIELGEIESVLGEYEAVAGAVVLAPEDATGQKRLVAYVVPQEGASPSVEDLRGFLGQRLPNYMVPSALMLINKFPTTPSGKIDRKALPALDNTRPELESDYLTPRTEAESTLARIWQDVLRLDRVGVNDNFFELGGDSILSIQVVARASQAGLSLTPRELFQHQTIAELAQVAGVGRKVDAEQEAVSGPVPLTPIQAWFFEQRLPEPQHYNQSVLLALEERLEVAALKGAVEQLVVHHDALRIRFKQEESGWRQENAGLEALEGVEIFSRIDLREMPEADQRKALEAAAAEVQASLDLEAGPVLRVVLFEQGVGKDRLLIVIHHLVVDGVSWRVLLEDLFSGYEQLRRGVEAIRLAPKTTSFRTWSERLREYAVSEALATERQWWEGLAKGQPSSLPLDHPEGLNDVSSSETVQVSLSQEETRLLLQEVPQAYRTQINDVLLTALTQAFAEWTGENGLLLDLEGHGREDLFEDVDLSRTVGWFTTQFPVRLALPAEAGDAGEALKSIKEQLREIPQRGIGYGILRYLCGDQQLAAALASVQPQVSFNYLGQLGQALPQGTSVNLAPESSGPTMSPLGGRSYLLEINGGVLEDQLQFSWSYSRNMHVRETIERLVEGWLRSLRELIAHCQSPEAGGCTPSDFSLVRIDQQTLDNLVGTGRWLEDLYPPSPMQQGMLFHSMYDTESGVYCEQLHCLLTGPLDPEAFRQAWQGAVDRHTIFRTHFSWDGLPQVVQVIHRQVELPWEEQDWRGLAPEEAEQQLESLLADDRKRGFEFDVAPLMRLRLIRMDRSVWRFVWSHHHALLDGWSVPIVLREVLLSYEALVQGKQIALPPPTPYRKYVSWLGRQDRAAAESFWRKRLEGFHAPTPLPLERSSRAPEEGTREYAVQDHRLSLELSRTLEQFARKHRLTLNTLVQGAWALLLSRFSGEEDVVFGTTVSGRSAALPGIESMVGLLINTLPVRAKISPDARVLHWLEDLQNQQVQSRQFEYAPLSDLQHWSQVPPGNPLFESLTVFENYPLERSFDQNGGRGGLEVRDVHSHERTNFPLVLSAVPGPQLSLQLQHDSERFLAADAERLLEYAERLLTEITAHPNQRLAELSLLSDRERHQLLVEWNATDKIYSREGCLHELVAKQAEERPDAVAVVFGDAQMTCRELDEQSNQLAHYLRAVGVGPDVLVGVYMERSLEMVVGLLGILKAGGAYVPLDPQLPQPRLQFMLEDTEAPVLLTQDRLQATLPEYLGHVVRMDADQDRIAQQPTDALKNVVAREQLAYVIYTSGSTGRPKGVMLPHQAIYNHMLWMLERFPLAETDRVLQKTPISFDASVWEFWAPLMAGSPLIMAEPGAHQDPQSLIDAIVKHEVTTLQVVPTLFRALLDAGEFAKCTSLRRVFCGGEPLPAELCRRFHDQLDARLVNLYGPTEAAIDVTSWECGPDEVGPTVAIGRPVDNTQVYILDAQFQPTPIGVPGELHLGGIQLARGYWKRPELTAEKFVADPFRDEPDARLYKTGDLARYRGDGRIEFLGRIDRQVKLRGFRIELGEIEAVLSGHPGVRQSVAMVREDEPDRKRLVAYIVPREQQSPASSELREFVQQTLPDYMVPTVFVLLDTLPLTPSGKVDQRSLPAPDASRLHPEKLYLAPHTEAETALVAIWQDVLRLDRVGLNDNFFELGGDSILSIQVVARAKQVGLSLTPREIFQHQTIAELAQVAEVGHKVDAEQEAVAGPVPLTPIQALFFERQLPETHHFNQSVLLALQEPPDVVALERAVEQLVVHHDALRMRFRQDESGWQQENAGLEIGDGAAVFSRMDHRDMPEADQRKALEAAAAEVQASLDLEAGPVLRVVLFEQGAGKDRLLMVIHHLVVDGVSWRVLLEDLFSGYEQLRLGAEEIRLAPKTTSFRAWSERLREYAVSDALANERQWWEGLAKGKSGSLPIDHPEGLNDVSSSETVRVSLSQEETRFLLQEVPQAYRTQINDVLLTALTQTFTQWTGDNGVLLDLEGHGREDLFEDVDLSRTVGWFTTLFPVRLELPADAGDPGEALKSIKEQLRGIPQRGIGYGVLRYLRGDQQLAASLGSLRPQVSFNYLGQLDQTLPKGSSVSLAQESSGPAMAPRGGRSHLLNIDGEVIDGRLQFSWTFSRNVHERRTIEQLAEAWLAALRELIEHCLNPDAGGATPSDFPLLQIDQQTLDKLVGMGQWVEDLYPASPLQQGMLFHSLYDPESGVYFEQVHCVLEGPLEPQAFRQAWRRVVARHSVFRTHFSWKGQQEALQVVHRRADLPWDELDWRGLTAEEEEQQLELLLKEDRKRGFEFGRPPLMRLILIRTDESVWRFVWSHHHVLLDGWSLPIVLREVLLTYEGLTHGEQVALPPVRPYRDYIAWLNAQDRKAAESFWRKRLDGFTAPTPLPLESPSRKPEDGAEAYGVQDHQLSPEASRTLEQFARRHRLTLSTLVQGAWALLLSRCSGDEDVLFGTTVSGRSAGLQGIESMVGLFINALPVRAKVSPEANVVSWLEAFQNQQAQMRQYEYTPLVEVQRWSDVDKGTPLFESLAIFENFPVDRSLREQTQTDLTVRDVYTNELTNYPLVLTAVPGPPLSLELQYEVGRFEPASARRLLEYLARLLMEMTADPTRTIADVSLLSDEERKQILVEWNATQADYPPDECVHQLFEAQAERSPDAVAVVLDDVRWTYRQLNERANQLGRELRDRGVGPDVLVGICLERSPNLVMAVLAVLKAGGGYVPLDPAYSRDAQERLNFVVRDACVSLVVTDTSLSDSLRSSGVPLVELDAEAESVRSRSRANVDGGATADSLAYVVYTSGSTGHPKGVMVTHGSLLNAYRGWEEAYRLGSDATSHLQMASFGFDVFSGDLVRALCSGGKLVICRKEVLLSPDELLSLIQREEVDIAEFVPVVLRNLVQHLEEIGRSLDFMRLVIVGSDAWYAPDHERVQRVIGPRTRLINSYGLTETTIDSSYFEGDAGALPETGSVPIGRPFPNVRLYVLDDRMQPVPIGVPGELYIGGKGVARGYVNRPDLNKERFLTDPFADLPGARLCRTGDRVRWRDDGQLEFLGRTDNQVKIRGFRVEPEEVESVLNEHPQVRAGVVVAREDAPGLMRLAAYAVAEDGTTPSMGELRRFLSARLPDYMVPSAFVLMDAFPTTSSGKVDRRALPAPDSSRPELETEYTAPRTEAESTLVGLWQDVLGVERIGVNDDFFELGGHSLLATQLISRVRDSLQVDVPLRSLFEHRTVASFATAIVDARIAGCLDSAPLLRRVERIEDLPLSFAQERLWFLDQLEPGSPFYNIWAAVRVNGLLNVEALQATLNEIVRRHEALRTTFATAGDRPVQRIAEELQVPFELVDLSETPQADREEEIQRRATAEAQRPFDLSEGPLLRVCLLRASDSDHVFLLTMHHIISDGWSMDVFIRELALLYGAFSAGQPSPLEELPFQYADYAVWQREWLSGKVLDEQFAYWRKQLADAPAALDLPTDRPRPAVLSHRGAEYRFDVSAELTESLDQLSRSHGATLFMTLLAAFQTLLSRYSGQDQVCVGTPIAGRSRSELESLIGFFVNTLVMRGDLSGDPSFEQLLARVKETTLGRVRASRFAV